MTDRNCVALLEEQAIECLKLKYASLAQHYEVARAALQLQSSKLSSPIFLTCPVLTSSGPSWRSARREVCSALRTAR